MPALNEVLLVPEDAVPSGKGRDGTEGESRITRHESGKVSEGGSQAMTGIRHSDPASEAVAGAPAPTPAPALMTRDS